MAWLVHTTAPPGYKSNHDAIIALLRFGFAIWSGAQMKALIFHAERSILYGRESNRHSEKQAMDGVYSVHRFEWVRGPCGLSRAAWYRANAELAIDQENPEKTPDGVLRRYYTGGGNQVVEYRIDWLAVKARIRKWQTSGEVQKFDLSPERDEEEIEAVLKKLEAEAEKEPEIS
jgi:hypothetical protein